MNENNKKVITKGVREFNFFSLFRFISNRYNHKIARQHLKHYPQLAIFAFDHIGLSINIDGMYEKHSLSLIKKFLKNTYPNSDKKVALDIGANIGNHSVFFSEIFFRIYAYEPNPHTFELLKINSTFSCPLKNIEYRNYGLSNKNSKVLFKAQKANIGGSLVIDSTKNFDPEIFLIDVKTLDSIVELKESDISLIKIDIEGHELQALMGAKELIMKNRPVILFEQHGYEIDGGSSPVINYLKNLDYKFATIENNFYFGENYFLKILSLIFRSIFGYQLKITDRVFFQRKFYDMIIAIPKF